MALCGIIWLVHPARAQVNDLEKQISYQYDSATTLLNQNTTELLEWDFNQPLKQEDKDYVYDLYFQFKFIANILFQDDVVHREWRYRMLEAEAHLMSYIQSASLSEKDRTDLHQVLQASYYITFDFRDYVKNPARYYEAMHDEQHEMVEVIKNRLDAQY